MTDSERETISEWISGATLPRVATEHTTYRLSDYLGWQRDGTLELRPYFQRGAVWSPRDRSLLVDSVICGYPLPVIVLQDEIHSLKQVVRKRVVDGQQRLRTLFSFVDASVLAGTDDEDNHERVEYHPPGLPRSVTLTFGDLPEEIQRRILGTRLPTVILETSALDANVLEAYDRLNSTGLTLNAQELRYARREGEFADLCYRMARHNQSRWTSWKLFRNNQISRMLEVEFTSELILLLMNGVEKTGRKEIDRAYRDEELKDRVPNRTRLESDLQIILDIIDDRLREHPKPDTYRPFRTKGWFYALFSFLALDYGALVVRQDDIVTTTTRTRDYRAAQATLDRVLALVPDALELARKSDAPLIRAISGSASDKASRLRRIEFLRLSIA